MKMVANKVAIIGCGVGGLAAIKSCLDAGLQPTCFEQQTWFGGIWNYTDDVRPNLGSVHGNTITNVSKAMMCFSDFPLSKESPNYMHHSQFMKYLEMYANKFDLQQYIKFSTKVERLSKTSDHKETGRWIISYTSMKGGNYLHDKYETIEETFDAVMVCTGHLWSQAWPKIPGKSNFKGVQVHSGDYRTFHPYVGKRVVVVGCSYSAGDIACELSQHASQVYLSTRRGGYIIKRLVPGKTKPFDHQFTRANEFLQRRLNLSLISGIVNKEYDFARLGLQPTGILGVHQFLFINDYLPQKVITGSVIVKGELKDLRETSVIVEGDEVLENIDAVIFCTGFKLEFPFASDIIPVEDEHYARLYKHIFIPNVDHQTLAVIGAPEIAGASVPVMEMQARVSAEAFAGRCVLPNKDERLQECVEWERELSKIGRRKEKYLYGLQYVPYMDELGEMIGAKPNLWSIFKKDPKLAYQCLFGPCVPAQYRLQGPNSNWEGARKVIMSTEENFQWPLRTRRCMPLMTQKKSTYVYHVFVIVMVIFIAYILSMLM